MKIKKTIETPSGGITFEGELNQDELDLVISTGLSFLFQQGALPFRVLEEEEGINLAPGSEESH